MESLEIVNFARVRRSLWKGWPLSSGVAYGVAETKGWHIFIHSHVTRSGPGVGRIVARHTSASVSTRPLLRRRRRRRRRPQETPSEECVRLYCLSAYLNPEQLEICVSACMCVRAMRVMRETCEPTKEQSCRRPRRRRRRCLSLPSLIRARTRDGEKVQRVRGDYRIRNPPNKGAIRARDNHAHVAYFDSSANPRVKCRRECRFFAFDLFINEFFVLYCW